MHIYTYSPDLCMHHIHTLPALHLTAYLIVYRYVSGVPPASARRPHIKATGSRMFGPRWGCRPVGGGGRGEAHQWAQLAHGPTYRVDDEDRSTTSEPTEGPPSPPPRDPRRWPLTAPSFSSPSIPCRPTPWAPRFCGGGGMLGPQNRPPQNQKYTGASPHCLIIVWLRASDRGRGLGPGAVMLTELSYLVPDTVASEVTAITAALTNGPRDSPKAEGTHRGRIGGGGFLPLSHRQGAPNRGATDRLEFVFTIPQGPGHEAENQKNSERLRITENW